MNEKERIRVSRFISLILRHKPDVIGIKLDKNGWAKVKELINGVNKRYSINFEDLEEIVRLDDKSRYVFNDDKTKIRASQGHSIDVDVELKEVVPPEILYHGTAYKYVQSIKNEGLNPQNRLYVHLSKDFDTAIKVGSRHGEPVVFIVHALKLYNEGYKFYLSENGVYLTKCVPIEFMEFANK